MNDHRELVLRARSGDRDAFARLAAAQIDRLYATAYLVVGSVESARDATQDALLAAWRGLPRLRDPDRFGPWLNRLLVRSCQRQRTWAGSSIEINSSALVHLETGIGLVADRDELERGFRRLPLHQRTILAMRFYLDLSVAEVAVALRIPEGTVKSRTNRALSAMRAGLDADARSGTPLLEETRP